jgi:hypothetical protein
MPKKTAVAEQSGNGDILAGHLWNEAPDRILEG